MPETRTYFMIAMYMRKGPTQYIISHNDQNGKFKHTWTQDAAEAKEKALKVGKGRAEELSKLVNERTRLRTFVEPIECVYDSGRIFIKKEKR